MRGVLSPSRRKVSISSSPRFDTFELKSLAPTGKAFLVLMALFVVFQFSALANFTISIDDELVALREDTSQWIREGRWAAYVLETYIITQPVVPYLPMALFGVFSAIGYIFLVKALGWKELDFLSFAVFPILIAFPIWSFTLAFSGSTPAAGLGVMLSGLMAYLFRQGVVRVRGHEPTSGRTASYILAAALLGSIAIGFYQSFLPFAVIAIFATILSLALEGQGNRDLARPILIGAGTIVLMILCYLAITKAVLFLTGRELSYVSDYYRPQFLIDRPWDVIHRTLSQMQSVYGGSPSIYGVNAFIFPVVLMIGAAGLILETLRSGGPTRAVLAALAVLILVTMPFGIHLLHGGKMPIRTLVAVPLVMCVIVLLGLRHAPAWLVCMGLIVLLPFYFTVAYALSSFSAARIFVQAHDQLLAGALGQRIGLVAGPPRWDEPVQFDQFGGQPFHTAYPRASGETLGVSVFEWSGGHPRRLASYLKLLGLANLNIVTDQRRLELLDTFILMPPWPAEGSVAMVDGTLLVKLSDRPNNIFAKLIETGAADVGKKPRPEPFFRLSSADAGAWSPIGATAAHQDKDGIVLSTEGPQIEFTVADTEKLRDCARIELNAQLKSKRGGVAAVQFKPLDEQLSRDDFTARAPVRPQKGDADATMREVTIRFVSRTGFADTFRFSLAGTKRPVTLTDIELRCMLRRP
jgi:hypothetical protein